jgi:ElaB/YqjD/DUF883 family membrane-anchored ribosome-binding protein
MKILNLTLLVASLFLLVACGKPTAESATKSWEANLKKVEELKMKYPNFKGALEETQAAATKEWNATQVVEEEEAKIAAMVEANRTLRPTYVRKLGDLGKQMEDLKDQIAEASQTEGVSSADLEAIKSAKNEANITLTRVEQMVMNTTVNTAAEAEPILKEADKQLNKAEERIKKVTDNVAKRVEKEVKEAEETTKKEEVANTPIKCNACGKNNDATAKNCQFCTAPLTLK